MGTRVGDKIFIIASGLVDVIDGPSKSNRLVLLGVKRAEDRVTVKGFNTYHWDGLRCDVAGDTENLVGPGPTCFLLEDASKTTETDGRSNRWKLGLGLMSWIDVQNGLGHAAAA